MARNAVRMVAAGAFALGLAGLGNGAMPAMAAEPEVGGVTKLVLYGYRTPAGAERAPIYERDPVAMRDTLETPRDAALVVQFVDDSLLTLGGAASMVIDEFVFDPAAGAGSQALSVARGAFRLISGAVPDETTRIETPTVVIGVRGTIIVGQVNEDGSGTVYCESGGCTVTSKTTGQVVELEAGLCCTIDSEGNVSDPALRLCPTNDPVVQASIGNTSPRLTGTDGVGGSDRGPSDSEVPDNDYGN